MNVDSYKIAEKDFEGKGVSVQPNPMELPEAEAKAVFDQLTKEVVTPKFNAFVEAFRELDLTSDDDKPISKDTKEALAKKVDKEFRTGSEDQYKVLSDNNFDDTAKKNVENSARDRHSHENKELLDTLDADWKENILYKDNTEPYKPVGMYNPATVEYVDNKVFETGAADMVKAVYDPNGKQQDIFAYADQAARIYDESGNPYWFKVKNGGLWIEPLEGGE